MSLREQMENIADAERDAFYDWVRIGIDRNWVSDIVCVTHHGLPNTDEEEKEWDEGHDPCVPGIRVWAV